MVNLPLVKEFNLQKVLEEKSVPKKVRPNVNE
jgi:hypothetical protein